MATYEHTDKDELIKENYKLKKQLAAYERKHGSLSKSWWKWWK